MALGELPIQRIQVIAAAALNAAMVSICVKAGASSSSLQHQQQHQGSLLFQMEDDAQPCHKVLSSSLQHVKERVAFFSAPCNAFCERLLRDVRCFSRALLREAHEVDTVELASKLSLVGYHLTVRNALGGGGDSCFRNLRHEFLVVRSPTDDAMEYIIDLHFREQFAIPQPSEEYLQVLAQAPEHFVGQLGRLMPVVQALCTEMAASFKAKGLELPPWRKTQSMLSKWMPSKSRDVSFSEPGTPCVQPQSMTAAAAAAAAFNRISADAVVQVTPAQAGGNVGFKRSSLHLPQQQQQQQQHTVKIGFAM